MENNKVITLTDDDNFRTDKLSSSNNKFREFWYILTVKNVAATDYGRYWCTATNKYGTNKTPFVLFGKSPMIE